MKDTTTYPTLLSICNAIKKAHQFFFEWSVAESDKSNAKRASDPGISELYY